MPQYPLGTVSDADDPSQPEWRDGAQVAQVAWVPPRVVNVPLPGTTGSSPKSPYPHEQPEVKAAGRQLERLWNNAIDNAGTNLNRWYEAGQAALSPFLEGENAPPSRPISDADQAAAQTPPLMPSKVNDKLEGRPAEERELSVEELIPPEMKDWIGGLEPFDQELARELLIVFNKKTAGRRGDEATRTGNAELVKAIMADLKQQRPEIGAYAEHVRGARRPDEKSESGYAEVPEEYIKGRDSGGLWEQPGRTLRSNMPVNWPAVWSKSTCVYSPVSR